MGLHCIKKWSSRGYLLEYLESSGTKTMMRGSIVLQLYMRGEETNKERPW